MNHTNQNCGVLFQYNENGCVRIDFSLSFLASSFFCSLAVVGNPGMMTRALAQVFIPWVSKSEVGFALIEHHQYSINK